jgi:hypothetical protein
MLERFLLREMVQRGRLRRAAITLMSVCRVSGGKQGHCVPVLDVTSM